MRTPNSKCVICEKPLYRCPNVLNRVRYVACMEHRAEVQKLSGITEKQQAGLSLGREKGTNHRTGYKHKEESKLKIAAANKAFWAARPELAMARGTKTRGPLNVRWKGGPKRLNLSVRQMAEYRRWADAVRFRDGFCVDCRSQSNLEADHVIDFAELLVRYGIKNREDARQCQALWDIANGRTLCELCHYKRHGRTPPYHKDKVRAAVRLCVVCGGNFRVKPSIVRAGGGKCCSRLCDGKSRQRQGSDNPNWRGDNIKVCCRQCGREFEIKPAIFAKGGGKFCGRECTNANRRKNV